MKKQKKCHPFIEQHYQHYVARCTMCGWSGVYQPDTAHAVQDYAMNHAPPVCECGHWRASHLATQTATFASGCRECGCGRFTEVAS